MIGDIKLFAGDFAPNGWALCNGAILPIAEYQALFSVIGTKYGGNGFTDFMLPNIPGVKNAGMAAVTNYIIEVQGS
jgi:microcystin-dependent protein